MLPGLTTPACLRRPLASCCALLLSLLMAFGLAGCSSVGQPPQRVLPSALALPIDLNQRPIASAPTLEAGGDPPGSRVRAQTPQALAIGRGKGAGPRGRFVWAWIHRLVRVLRDPYVL